MSGVGRRPDRSPRAEKAVVKLSTRALRLRQSRPESDAIISGLMNAVRSPHRTFQDHAERSIEEAKWDSRMPNKSV
jgi:hypothetical protein